MGGGENESDENGSGKENDIGCDCSDAMDFSVRCDKQSEAPNTGRKQ